MAYKKPQIIAKSAPKQSYVAGCPEHTHYSGKCVSANARCMTGPIK